MIPFSPPDINEDDIAAVAEVLRSGWITTGPMCQRFEDELTAFTGAAGTVVLNSATAALEMALRVAGVGPGDEVVVPAYTYTATASVVAHVGATIVMADNAPGHLTPSARDFLDRVTDRTRAVIVVDVAGIPFPVDELRTGLGGVGRAAGGLLEELGRPVLIADAAHSLGATLDGARTGSLADLTAFSFHAVKNLTTAEGGALQWRQGLPAESARIERLVRVSSLHGQSKDARSKMLGASWEYDIEALAWKCNMPDVLAALGLSQLRRYEGSVDRRLTILDRYAERFEGSRIRLVEHVTESSRSSGHLAICRLEGADLAERNDFIVKMRDAGVSTNVHYKPLPLHSGYRALGFAIDGYPNAFEFYSTEVTLPLHTLLTKEDVEFVCDRALECLR